MNTFKIFKYSALFFSVILLFWSVLALIQVFLGIAALAFIVTLPFEVAALFVSLVSFLSFLFIAVAFYKVRQGIWKPLSLGCKITVDFIAVSVIGGSIMLLLGQPIVFYFLVMMLLISFFSLLLLLSRRLLLVHFLLAFNTEWQFFYFKQPDKTKILQDFIDFETRKLDKFEKEKEKSFLHKILEGVNPAPKNKVNLRPYYDRNEQLCFQGHLSGCKQKNTIEINVNLEEKYDVNRKKSMTKTHLKQRKKIGSFRKDTSNKIAYHSVEQKLRYSKNSMHYLRSIAKGVLLACQDGGYCFYISEYAAAVLQSSALYTPIYDFHSMDMDDLPYGLYLDLDEKKECITLRYSDDLYEKQMAKSLKYGTILKQDPRMKVRTSKFFEKETYDDIIQNLSSKLKKNPEDLQQFKEWYGSIYQYSLPSDYSCYKANRDTTISYIHSAVYYIIKTVSDIDKLKRLLKQLQSWDKTQIDGDILNYIKMDPNSKDRNVTLLDILAPFLYHIDFSGRVIDDYIDDFEKLSKAEKKIFYVFLFQQGDLKGESEKPISLVSIFQNFHGYINTLKHYGIKIPDLEDFNCIDSYYFTEQLRSGLNLVDLCLKHHGEDSARLQANYLGKVPHGKRPQHMKVLIRSGYQLLHSAMLIGSTPRLGGPREKEHTQSTLVIKNQSQKGKDTLNNICLEFVKDFADIKISPYDFPTIHHLTQAANEELYMYVRANTTTNWYLITFRAIFLRILAYKGKTYADFMEGVKKWKAVMGMSIDDLDPRSGKTLEAIDHTAYYDCKPHPLRELSEIMKENLNTLITYVKEKYPDIAEQKEDINTKANQCSSYLKEDTSYFFKQDSLKPVIIESDLDDRFYEENHCKTLLAYKTFKDKKDYLQQSLDFIKDYGEKIKTLDEYQLINCVELHSIYLRERDDEKIENLSPDHSEEKYSFLQEKDINLLILVAALREIHYRLTSQSKDGAQWLRLEQLVTLLIGLYPENKIIQSKTNEGKTLIFTLCLLASALCGKKAILFTHDDASAEKSSEEVKKIAQYFDLKVATHLDSLDKRKRAGILISCSSMSKAVLHDLMETQEEVFSDSNLQEEKRPFAVFINEGDLSAVIQNCLSSYNISNTKKGQNKISETMSEALQKIYSFVESHNIQKSLSSYYVTKNGKLEEYDQQGLLNLFEEDIDSKPIESAFDSDSEKTIYWINAFIDARDKKKNEDYIIDKDNFVRIVNVVTTGRISDRNSHWVNGVYEAVACIEGLPVYEAGEPICQGSIAQFLEKFHKKEENSITLMSGTLGRPGSKLEAALLDIIGAKQGARYNIPMAKRPFIKINPTTAKDGYYLINPDNPWPRVIENKGENPKIIYRRVTSPMPYLLGTEEEWLTYLVETLIKVVEKKETALVCLNTIEECELLKEILVSNTHYNNVQIFNDVPDHDSGKIVTQAMILKNIENKAVYLTLTTELGGRDIDYKGLDHVIIAKPTLPNNLNQKVARVAREIKALGTVLLILCAEHLTAYYKQAEYNDEARLVIKFLEAAFRVHSQEQSLEAHKQPEIVPAVESKTKEVEKVEEVEEVEDDSKSQDTKQFINTTLINTDLLAASFQPNLDKLLEMAKQREKNFNLKLINFIQEKAFYLFKQYKGKKASIQSCWQSLLKALRFKEALRQTLDKETVIGLWGEHFKDTPFSNALKEEKDIENQLDKLFQEQQKRQQLITTTQENTII